ncbi:MAG: hypothetical protein RLZZ142_2387, partial [Verrucomicrobiota bacterium]
MARSGFEGAGASDPTGDGGGRDGWKDVGSGVGRCTSTGNLERSRERVGELAWQARWFSGGFGRTFLGQDGERVEVIQFGFWNRGAGPDFVGASVSINGAPPCRGAVELDMHAADWERHGHAGNPDYREVCLHVFVHAPARGRFFTRTLENRRVPQVCLRGGAQEDGEKGEGESGWFGAEAPAWPGRCSVRFSGMSLERVEAVVVEAARRRFERKGREFSRMANGHGRREALYQLLAAGMGYAGNELPFTLLSQRLPVSALSGAPAGGEGALFGVAGFLSAPSFWECGPDAREKVQALWEGWWRVRGELEGVGLDRGLWRLAGRRPLNHPQRRLGALAAVVRHWRAVFGAWDRRDWRGLRERLLSLSDPFWERHCRLEGGELKRGARLLGRERVDALFANAFFPAAGDWEGWCRWGGGGMNERCRRALARMFPGRREVWGRMGR